MDGYSHVSYLLGDPGQFLAGLRDTCTDVGYRYGRQADVLDDRQLADPVTRCFAS
jgi:hypothetical protein